MARYSARKERWIQLVKLSSGQYVIGFDNGYQFGKTAQSLFDNGVYAMGTVEPTVKEHSLKYSRKYYKVGEGRAAITEDKVSDENARLLTMVAIAKELGAEGIRKAEVILAVGLPFSDYGREKKALLEYYGQKPTLKYEYEGIRYDVTISRIYVFPQCYSAIAPGLANMKGDYLVVDIGSKTTDVLLFKNGMPVERRTITVEKAMVKWMKQIQYGKNVPESEILKIVLKKDSFLPRNQVNHVRETLRELIHGLDLELMEREFDLQYTNVIYVGGGAVAVKNFSEPRTNVAFDTDIYANAKGYEFLAMQMLWKTGAA